MAASERQQSRALDESLETRRARRRHRYRMQASGPLEGLDPTEGAAPELPLPTTPPVFEAPQGVSPGELCSTAEELLAAARQCVHQAERLYGAGDEAATVACLIEASDLFAALDDFEAAALAGGAADAARLDEVIDELIGALDAHRL